MYFIKYLINKDETSLLQLKKKKKKKGNVIGKIFSGDHSLPNIMVHFWNIVK